MAEPARRTVVEVRVELKPGIFDAEADSVRKSLLLLGVDRLRSVATARIYRLEFESVDPSEARRLAQEAAERLLANPVVHRVELTERDG